MTLADTSVWVDHLRRQSTAAIFTGTRWDGSIRPGT